MDVEMLAHFDEWQRSRQHDNYEAQDQWPLELRRLRFILAEYFQAQIARGKLIREVKESFKVDAFVGKRMGESLHRQSCRYACDCCPNQIQKHIEPDFRRHSMKNYYHDSYLRPSRAGPALTFGLP